jgi:hypothetical protein
MNILKKTMDCLKALRDLASWREKDFRKAGVDTRYASEISQAGCRETQ